MTAVFSRISILSALMLIFAGVFATATAEPAVYTGRLNNVAVQGYDTVAYFTEGQPVNGTKEFSTEYQGAEWLFSSQENLDAFVANPDNYAPQYGGYCAWAVAQGKFAKGNAKNWSVIDGKLYLNYNNSIQEKWEADTPGFIQAADTKWPEISK